MGGDGATPNAGPEAAPGVAGRKIRLRCVHVGVVALAVVYVVVRLMLVWCFPPHVDEALFARLTLKGFEDRHLLFLPLAWGNNPMQEWVGIGVMHLGVEPLTALRLVSLASGLITLFVVAWLARALGGDKAALAAALVWAVLPFTVVYGAVGLTDPLVMAMVAVAIALQLAIARRPRLLLALLLGIVIGVGLLTKLTMTIALWLMPLGALVFDWRPQTLRSRLLRWLGSLALAVAVAALSYQVLRLSDAYATTGEQRDALLSMHSVGTFLDDPTRWLRDNWTSYRVALRGYLTVPLVLTATVGVAAVLRTMIRLADHILSHKRLVVAFWAIATVAAFAAVGPAGKSLSQQFNLPGREGFETNEQIAEVYGNGGDIAPLVAVVTLPRGSTVDSPGVIAELRAALAKVKNAMPDVRIASYASDHDRAFVSSDGRTTFALVYHPARGGVDPGQAEARTAQAALEGVTVAGSPVEVTGMPRGMIETLRTGSAPGVSIPTIAWPPSW